MLFSAGAFLAICFGVLYWRKSRQIDEQVEEIHHGLEDMQEQANQTAISIGRNVVDFVTSATIDFDLLRYHVRRVRKLCANKFSILVYTGQVVYQFANIVTGYEFDFHYPEPANWVVEHMSLFGLSIISLSPPECVNPRSNFYTRVLIATLGPLIVIVAGIALFFGFEGSHVAPCSASSPC